MLRVLVCDDSMGFPALVAAWLDDDARFDHAGTAQTGTELLDLAHTTPADVVLLDLVLPDVDNPAALVRQLHDLLPGVKVVLVSSLAAAELERAAAAAGADGWVHKAITARDLTDALCRVAAGGQATA
jgi:DNA-binding NarL/FixJ family response regulator